MFYIIFYTVLATLFALMLWVFYQTLDPRIPKWQTDRSLIGTNPGQLLFADITPFLQIILLIVSRANSMC